MLKFEKALKLKTAAAGILLLTIILVFAAPHFRSDFLDSLSAIYASVLIKLANQDRLAANISELEASLLLEQAAQLKADDMATKSYFSHNTPDGKTPWYFFDEVGYKYIYAGENLAVNFQDSEEIEKAWANSPRHFWNIMNPRYTEIGIATSTGIYKGRKAVFVVQLFGTPAK